MPGLAGKNRIRPEDCVISSWNGARLEEILDAAHVSRKELAVAIGVPPNYVTRWIGNDHEPLATHVWKIVDALKIEPNALRQPVGSFVDFIEPPDLNRKPRKPGRPRKPKPDDTGDV